MLISFFQRWCIRIRNDAWDGWLWTFYCAVFSSNKLRLWHGGYGWKTPFASRNPSMPLMLVVTKGSQWSKCNQKSRSEAQRLRVKTENMASRHLVLLLRHHLAIVVILRLASHRSRHHCFAKLGWPEISKPKGAIIHPNITVPAPTFS